MDKQDSDNDDVVFTRFEEAEKGGISDLDMAIRNSLQPVEAKAAGANAVPVTRLGAGGAAGEVPEMQAEVGGPRILTYTTLNRVGGISEVTAQSTTHDSESQHTTHKDLEELVFWGGTYLACGLYPDNLDGMILVCKNAGGEEHVVHIAYATEECVRITLMQGTMDINQGVDVGDGGDWVSKTCQKRGDTCTVTGFKEFKLGLHDMFEIKNIPAPEIVQGGAQKRKRGPEGGVGGPP